MARKNLYPSDASFEGVSATGVTALGGATLSISTDYAIAGDQSLLVTKGASNHSGFISNVPIPVTAGTTYAVSVYGRLPVTVPAQEEADLTLQVEYRNFSNTVVATTSSSVLELVDDLEWGRVAVVGVAPVGAVAAYVKLTQVLPGTAGAEFIADAILFEQATYVGGYIDNYTIAQVNTLVNRALATRAFQVFQGLQLNADVTINDLVLNTIDEFGTLWIVDDIDGWWGQATPDMPAIDRGTEDGQYDVAGRYTARDITLTGSFWPADTDASLSASIDRLVVATNLVRGGAWLRANEKPTKAAFVRLVGKPQFTTINASGRTDFSIPLRAADPVKYEWDDSDPLGFSHVHLDAATEVGTATNNGTADVTAVFTVTGPIGAGSSIYNSDTDQTIDIVSALRGKGPVATLATTSVYQDVATITTTANHHLIVGDEISIAGAGAPFDSVNTTYIVTGASQIYPYEINFDLTSDDLASAAATGQVTLVNNDVLVIDTYQRSVVYNGVGLAQRSKLGTLTDWVKFAPGKNTLVFDDDVDHLVASTKKIASGIATITTNDTHYLIPGETIVIDFSTAQALAFKSLTSNVITLTTVSPHGFSVGDTINVSSTELSTVVTKQMGGGTATLTTALASGVNVGDAILVNIPASATASQKQLVSNLVTITTSVAHGFSAGDSVTVTLATSASVVTKALNSNQATLTTAAAHNFQIGDSITVSLNGSGTITNKAKSGSSAIMTTAVAHGFSTGDVIVIALPTTATLTNTRSMGGIAGNYLATLNTSAAHNFSVGDSVTINIGVTSTRTTTSRTATTSAATVTLSATHGWSVGDIVTISGMGNAQYNGTFTLTAVTSNTITYAIVSGTAEGATADTAGTTINNTIATGYNGTHYIETIPSTTSFTIRAWNQASASSSTTAGTGATLTDNTNTGFNGTKTLTSASGTSFAYNY